MSATAQRGLRGLEVMRRRAKGASVEEEFSERFPSWSWKESDLQWRGRIRVVSRSSDRAVGTGAASVLGALLLDGEGELLLLGGGEDGEDGSEGIHLDWWFGGWRRRKRGGA
ncbi:hypothetical protein BKA70DRAFT_1222074 [Coprinopsis sp. MPI-PUGE-AT-0042]|nr:hypothetical protein BKA70DRAFT_1222074 [Coprinopsis sp. MPI-PUGE-AT-0042]